MSDLEMRSASKSVRGHCFRTSLTGLWVNLKCKRSELGEQYSMIPLRIR
ncbi:hypothetical protein [Microcoleus sp. FACHB-68]|nr:hypothetical protein [Microcoleus sp. FACHB-68]MBD1936530.1 hypothetical protein [Microcoleus sp. FACHB-68]